MAFKDKYPVRTKIVINNSTLEPVSYTHLDVYKRQTASSRKVSNTCVLKSIQNKVEKLHYTWLEDQNR